MADSPIYVIYHDPCMDGFSAAWVARKRHLTRSRRSSRRCSAPSGLFRQSAGMAHGEYPKINGERLREIRMSRGLTLRRLEQASGVRHERPSEPELGGGGAEGDTDRKAC